MGSVREGVSERRETRGRGTYDREQEASGGWVEQWDGEDAGQSEEV
jgi:hypothetical protein